jgi:hypothetical protein
MLFRLADSSAVAFRVALISLVVSLGGVTACRSARTEATKGDTPFAPDISDCAELAGDPTFGGHATVIAEMDTGPSKTCTIEVKDAADVLKRFALTTRCPVEASILLPFVHSGRGWTLDRAQLDIVDNGGCLSPGT